MAEITLEQRVVLAVAWLRKSKRLARGRDALSAGDLPPGYTLAADDFIVRQCTLARQATEALEAEIEELRRSHADAVAIASFKRSKLPERIVDGKLDARKANNASSELAVAISRAEEEINRCDALLGMIRDEDETVTPNLPLFQYALTWREFQESSPSTPENKETAPPEPPSPRPKSIAAFWRRMDRSDRIALVLAALLSVCILTGGFLYMYVWGRLSVEIIPLDRYQYTVRFVNTYGEPLTLQVPYDGTGLPEETPALYGVSVTITDTARNNQPLESTNPTWLYKDQPADLYGPILVPPVSSVELTLHIPPGEIPEGSASLRLAIYRAPHKRYTVKTVEISEAS